MVERVRRVSGCAFRAKRPGLLAAALTMLCTSPTLAVTWTFAAGTPAGWQTSGQRRSVNEPLGRRDEVTFALIPGDLTFGLSAGEPELPARRAVQLSVREGKLSWYDGAAWRPLAPLDAAKPATVTLRLRRDEGRIEVDWGADQAVIPFWHQVGFPDTLFLEGTGGRVMAVRTSTPPPRPVPVLDAQALGATAVRLRWSPLEGQVSGFRLYKDGRLLASPSPGSKLMLDTEVKPRTRYEYRLEALGGGSATRALVTGPETEVAPASGTYDVVIYGGTPAGIAAAVTLGRHGRRVALIEPGQVIGGMMTGGLGRTDFGSIHALGGMFKEYLDAVTAYYTNCYGPNSPQLKAARGGLYFEPHVARAIFLEWLAAQPTVRLMRGAHLVGVDAVGGTVRAAVIEDREKAVRRVVRAPLFIDASYEGDLAAYAGASYLIGREPSTRFGEQYAGELWWDVWKTRVVKRVGTGDRTVQAYNYRLCLTRQVDNRLPPPPPDVYDRQRYLSLLPDIAKGRLKRLEDILSILPLPGDKGDANNHPQGNPSSDLVHGADAYPEGTHRERLVLEAAHRDHLLGLLWFLRFDPEVPEPLRLDTQGWGLCRDEFPEDDGWPSQIYVREGRRILGETVFTEHDAMAEPGGARPPLKRDSIAVGAYPIDSHATGGRDPQNPDLLEGFFYLARGETKPYQIPAGILLPQRLTNVVVTCALSASHVGYGTLRMEPVFMALGTAAGVLTDHALAGRPLRDPDLTAVQRDLLAAGQVLTVLDDVDPDTPGRDGFNLFGTFGAFPSYQAEPAAPLTGGALRAWVCATPWPTWHVVANLAPSGTEPLTGEAFTAVLTALARKEQLAAPAPLTGATVTRGEAMAALWKLVPSHAPAEAIPAHQTPVSSRRS